MPDPFDHARQALRSARTLLRSNDSMGAANRAYYAIFYASRAVLQYVAKIDPLQVKTHQGLRRLFDLHIVRPGLIDRAVASHFKNVEATRLSGDYEGLGIDHAEAEAALRDAHTFVQACEELVRRQKP